jgi:NADH-quinone oxidoreductase subunit I
MQVDRKPMTFAQRLYYPAIAQGLWITSLHFFRNLWLHSLQKLGMAKDKEAMVTIEYPEVVKPSPWTSRTRHRLTQREDGTPKCVACMMCATACPADCIFIVAAEHPDPDIEKYPKSFDIDMSKCVFCGFCVEACPKDAIRMDTGIVELASHDRRELIFNIGHLMREDVVLPHADVPAEFHINPLVRP